MTKAQLAKQERARLDRIAWETVCGFVLYGRVTVLDTACREAARALGIPLRTLNARFAAHAWHRRALGEWS